jgi:prevent-host-death family protein
MYIFLTMRTISVPISQARTDFCRLIEKVSSGKVRVLVTDHGQPKAQILPFAERVAPWRVAEPDDAARYGDLQSPVMENWK